MGGFSFEFERGVGCEKNGRFFFVSCSRHGVIVFFWRGFGASKTSETFKFMSKR